MRWSWSPKGSDEYVRTYRAVMKKTIRAILEAASSGSAYEALDEAEAIETAMEVLTRKGMSEETAKAQADGLKACARDVLLLTSGRAVQSESSPAPPPAAAAEREIEQDDQAAEKKEELEAKYVVSVGARRHGARPIDCLHSRSGCWRGRGLTFAHYELLFDDVPLAGSYNAVCKTCWPSGLPGSGEQEASGSEVEDSSSSSS